MCFNNHKIAYLCGAECGILMPFYDVKASCGLPTEQGDVPPEMIRVPGGDFDGLNTYTISVKGDSMVGRGIYDGDVLQYYWIMSMKRAKSSTNYCWKRTVLGRFGCTLQ